MFTPAFTVSVLAASRFSPIEHGMAAVVDEYLRATAEECVGLAPHALHVFDGDPSLDANLQYCSKLVEAGVFVNLSVWGGCNHEALINAYLTEMYDEEGTFAQRFIQTVDEEVNEFIRHDLRRK